MQQFTAYARLVAHNSFIHCFAELGLIGGCLFLGAFVFALLGMIRVAQNPERLQDPDLKAMFPYIMSIFVCVPDRNPVPVAQLCGSNLHESWTYHRVLAPRAVARNAR